MMGGFRLKIKLVIGTHAFKITSKEDASTKHFVQMHSNTKCLEFNNVKNLNEDIKKLFQEGENLVEKLNNYDESGLSIHQISSISVQYGACTSNKGGCLNQSSGCEELTLLYNSRGINNIEPQNNQNKCFSNSYYFIKEAFNVKNELKNTFKCENCNIITKKEEEEKTKKCKQCEKIVEQKWKLIRHKESTWEKFYNHQDWKDFSFPFKIKDLPALEKKHPTAFFHILSEDPTGYFKIYSTNLTQFHIENPEKVTVFPFLLKPIFDNSTLEISNHFMPIANISKLSRIKRKRSDGKGYNSSNTITCPLCLKHFYKHSKDDSVNSLCISENPVIYPPPTLNNKFHTHFEHCRKGEEQIVKFPHTNKLQFDKIEVCNIFSCVYKYLILLSCQQINNIFYFTGASRTSYHSLCRF